MFRKWILLIGVFSLTVILSGCGKPLEAQIDTALSQTKTVFAAEPEETTETVGKIKLFLPSGFKVEKSEDDLNIILSKGDTSYILFVNEQEGPESNLNYELLKQDTSKDIIEETTFEQDGIFGFSAVIKNTEDSYELVASLGGVKMTTISKEKDVENNLEAMLKIVRSVEWKDKK